MIRKAWECLSRGKVFGVSETLKIYNTRHYILLSGLDWHIKEQKLDWEPSVGKITWILGKFSDVSSTIHSAAVNLEDCWEGLSLANTAVPHCNIFVSGCGHKAPFQHSFSAVCVRLVEESRKNFVSTQTTI
jgi:hypothetical protein